MNINNIKNMDSKQNRHSDVNILATLRIKIHKKKFKKTKRIIISLRNYTHPITTVFGNNVFSL